MTVVLSTQFAIKPGRLEDAAALAVEAAKLTERHGARENRWFAAAAAGEATGTCLFLTEYENSEALGTSSDEMNASGELRTFMERVGSDQSPIVMAGQSLASEIPLNRDGNPERGQILETHVSTIVSGRLEQLMELSAKCADFVESHGASHATLTMIGASGTFANAVSISWEFPDMKTWGRMADAWLSDPQGLEIYQSVYGENPPSVEVFTGLYRAIPI